MLICLFSHKLDTSSLLSYLDIISGLCQKLFDEYMKMRKGNKSVLVNKLALFAESSLEEADVELVDGNEALYHILWPKC